MHDGFGYLAMMIPTALLDWISVADEYFLGLGVCQFMMLSAIYLLPMYMRTALTGFTVQDSNKDGAAYTWCILHFK